MNVDEDDAVGEHEVAGKASTARGGWALGAVFVLLAVLALLAAGGGFAASALEYLEGDRAMGAHFFPFERFKLRMSFIADVAPLVVRTAVGAGAWLAALAIVAGLVEALWVSGADTIAAPSIEARGAGPSRRVGTLFVASACIAVVAFAYLGLERERVWIEWAAMGPVALAGLFGAIRAHRRVKVPRLPRLIVPLLLATSGFLIGVAEVAHRWYVTGLYLQFYKGPPMEEADINIARANRPIGLLALVPPILVLITFAAWRWAEDRRPTAAVRSFAPLVLIAGASLLGIAYVGSNARLRRDLGAETQGSGSNEDFAAYVRVKREKVFSPVE